MTHDEVHRSVLAFLDQFISRGAAPDILKLRDQLAAGDRHTRARLESMMPRGDLSEREGYDAMRGFLTEEWETGGRRHYSDTGADLADLVDWTEWETTTRGFDFTSDPAQWSYWIDSVRLACNSSDERGQQVVEFQASSAALRDALADVGVEVSSVDDLYNQRLDHKVVVPVLIDWLPRIDDPMVKESAIRALTVPPARPSAAPVLIEEFRRVDDPTGLGLRWVIGNALSVVADDSVFHDVADLAQDRQWGRAREMVVVALGNMHDPQAVAILRQLLSDDEVAGHAIIALRKSGATEARSDIEPFQDHPKAWVRQEARKALKKLGG